jgi:glyoxylase-like metal-dependent hydrolase (beta-lactamase superfamily II)
VLVGEIEVTPVFDATGVLGELRELYPDVPAGAWAPYRELYPELFAGDSWRLPCHGYLVRSAGIIVLVDTGIGPPGLWEDYTPERDGLLPSSLEELGVKPDDVDVVFLTHLHIDHIGWNTDVHGVPFFPRARYVVHRDALAYARKRSELVHIRRCVEPLVDRFETVAGDFELAAGIRAFAAPGHYPGHMALRVVSGRGEAVLIGDTAVHPALLSEPDWVYVFDQDAQAAVATRRDLLPRLVDRDVLVACAHYPGGGIGRVVTREGRVVWEPVT